MTLNNPLRHPFRVPRVEQPHAEGRFYLPGNRRLGYAEFGDPSGAVVLWFHGTPGGRRQLPLLGRRAAEKLGLRVVVVERPGSGLSDSHAYAAVADWATDMANVADLARRFAPALSKLRRPMAALSSGLLLPLIPFAHYAYQAYSGISPEGDQRVFADPEIEAMFVDDIVVTAKGRFQALIDDARLFGQDWGFRLADVKAPVRWWHGDADPLVPLAAAQEAVSRLADADLVLLPGESHLGGFGQADTVLEFVRSYL